MPVYLKQIAKDRRWSSNLPANYVSFGYGNAVENGKKFKSEYPAVTLSVSKVKGADAMKISEQILDQSRRFKENFNSE